MPKPRVILFLLPFRRFKISRKILKSYTKCLDSSLRIYENIKKMRNFIHSNRENEVKRVKFRLGKDSFCKNPWIYHNFAENCRLHPDYTWTIEVLIFALFFPRKLKKWHIGENKCKEHTRHLVGKGWNSAVENPQHYRQYIWHICFRKPVPALLKRSIKWHSHIEEHFGNTK